MVKYVRVACGLVSLFRPSLGPLIGPPGTLGLLAFASLSGTAVDCIFLIAAVIPPLGPLIGPPGTPGLETFALLSAA